MKIYIDPQHGGIDTGLRHNGTNEKDIALSSALTLKSSIKGHETFISRESDILAISADQERTHGSGSIDTQYRADMANKHKVSLFVGLGMYNAKLRNRYKTDGKEPIVLTMRRTQLINKILGNFPDAKVVEYDKILFKPFLGLTDPHYYQLMLLNMDGIIVLMGDISEINSINLPEVIKKLADSMNTI